MNYSYMGQYNFINISFIRHSYFICICIILLVTHTYIIYSNPGSFHYPSIITKVNLNSCPVVSESPKHYCLNTFYLIVVY